MDRRTFLRRAPAAPPASLAAAVVAAAPPQPLPFDGGLAAFTPSADQPWDRGAVKHLLRRTGYAQPEAQIADLLARAPADAAGWLVDQALAAGTPPRPSWADLRPPPTGASQAEIDAYNTANSAGNREAALIVQAELKGTRHPGSPLRERLALMWHSHVPTNLSTAGSRASRLYRYWDLFRVHGLGDFQAMIRAMGTTQQMLSYLNGNQNRVGSPNENYARELMELFTTGILNPDGQPNYTQADVSQLARALTGWTIQDQVSYDGVFVASRFDSGSKTIFGVTAPFTYETAHDLLFSARAESIAHTVCLRLYREFVHDVPNLEVVAQMRALFQPAFRVEPVLRALLASRHFHSAAARGVKIKHPYEFAFLLVDQSRYTGLDTPASTLTPLGYDLFRPPDVSGWDGGRTWLDTGLLPMRWLYADRHWSRRTGARALALALSPVATDPYALVDALADHLFALPISAADRAECLSVLLGGIPDYEWNTNATTAETRVREALRFLTRLPEYQLA